MRRILFASALKACEVLKEPGLGYSRYLRPGHPVSRGKAGAGEGREEKLRLRVPMLDLAGGSFMGPLAGIRGACLSALCWDSERAPGLASHVVSWIWVLFFCNCSTCPPLTPSPTAGSLLFLQDESRL